MARLRSVTWLAIVWALVVLAIAASKIAVTDIGRIDFAGHLSSAVRFNEGLFHRHEDHHFLGSIHGLFYPPLEDFVLGGWLRIGAWLGLSQVPAFRVHLVFTCALYLFAVALAATRMRTLRGALLFLAVVTGHFFSGAGTLYLQGLRLGDLTAIGLSAQPLGGAAFFFVLAEIHGRRRAGAIALGVAGAICSHIVMGMVAGLLVALAVLSGRDRHRLVSGTIVALGLSAFFWVPFAAHGDMVIKNIVLSGVMPIAGLAAACVVWLAARSLRHLSALPLALYAISQAAIVASALHLPGVPRFHFYRFDSIALLSMGFCAGLVLERWRAAPSRARRWLSLAVAPAALAALAVDLRETGLLEYTASDAKVTGFDRARVVDDRYGRLLVIEGGRSFDFVVESMLTASEPDLRVAKGLFWESAPSNGLLISYLVAIGGPPSVLEYVTVNDMTCPLQECIVDNFFSDFNVRGLAYEDVGTGPEGWGAKACFATNFSSGRTRSYALRKSGAMHFGARTFEWARVEPSIAGGMTNAAVTSVSGEIFGLPSKRKDEARYYFSKVVQDCREGVRRSRVHLTHPELARLRALAPDLEKRAPEAVVTPAITKVGSELRLDLPDDEVRLYRVKLNPLPGLVVRDAAGNDVPWFRGFPHFFVLGKGPTFVSFRRTAPMWAGYAITAATLAVVLARALRMWGTGRARRRTT